MHPHSVPFPSGYSHFHSFISNFIPIPDSTRHNPTQPMDNSVLFLFHRTKSRRRSWPNRSRHVDWHSSEVRDRYRDVATNRAGDSAIKFLLRIARCFLWQSFGLGREWSSRDRLHRHLISLPINVPATIASRRIYIHLLTYSFRPSSSFFIMLLHCHVFFGVPLTGLVIRRFSGESDSL